MDEVVQGRTTHYDVHYRTAGWVSHCWTIETLAARLVSALDVQQGGRLDGNEIQYALRVLGAPDLQGQKILDYCCGTGVTAVYLALCGAEVWAFDASSEAINIAGKSAEMSGVADRTHFAVADAQSLPYPNSFFDGAFCQSALHIIIDYPNCPYELSRVLKPGRKAVFCEVGLAYSPFLMPVRWLRRRKWIKCGGRPLKYPDIEQFGEPFSRTEMQHFNLLMQVKMVFKGQLSRQGRLKPWSKKVLKVLENADKSILAAIPRLEKYCGSVVVNFIK